ncbi:MAG: MarR family winged helix-turn-helix transcriptional regulator [Chloroflexota bacterium]
MSWQEPTPSSHDALWQVGTMLRLLRALDQQLRVTAPDAASLVELSVLSRIVHGIDLPSQVARALRMDPARVTHVVDRLVSIGALTRTIDPADRRCWRLGLTESGMAYLAEGKASMRAALEVLLAGLADDERAAFSAGLVGVRRVLDELASA